MDLSGKMVKQVEILSDGMSVSAKVVDECDSRHGCDKEHAGLIVFKAEIYVSLDAAKLDGCPIVCTCSGMCSIKSTQIDLFSTIPYV